MKRLRRLGLTLGTLAWTSWAHADLGADVRALMAARVGHARVVRLKPRLLERGDLLPLPIPPALLDPKDSTCTTVSLLGVVGLHFVVRFAGSARSAATALRPEPSAAGAHEVTRCGESKPLLAGLLLEMRSPRGVIETLVTNAPGAVPRLAETLDGRDPGLELPLGDPGARPALPPLRMRVDRLRARAKQAAAASIELDRLQAGPEGSGARALFLEAGCHELSLLAESGPDLDTDLDLELVDSESEAVLGLDRSDDTDASLSVCVGARTRAELRFVGARANASLELSHAAWEIPASLPRAWGAEPLSRLARLARARHLSLQGPPIYGSVGVQGTTELPVEVEPDACYSVLLVPLRGAARDLSLSARADAPGEVPRGESDVNGSAVTFCAAGARHARLEVTGEGGNLAWLLALWESGRGTLGVLPR